MLLSSRYFLNLEIHRTRVTDGHNRIPLRFDFPFPSKPPTISPPQAKTLATAAFNMPRPTGHLAAAASSLFLRRALSVLLPRSYSAVALQDYYYDSYSDSEDEAPGHDRGSPSSLAGSLVTERGVQWVVIGDRGAKKGLYAQRLSKLLQVPYISMGSLVRQELEPRSSLYKQVAILTIFF